MKIASNQFLSKVRQSSQKKKIKVGQRLWKLYPLFKDVNYIGYIYIYVCILRKRNPLMLCQKSKLTLSLMNPTFLKNWDIFY